MFKQSSISNGSCYTICDVCSMKTISLYKKMRENKSRGKTLGKISVNFQKGFQVKLFQTQGYWKSLPVIFYWGWGLSTTLQNFFVHKFSNSTKNRTVLICLSTLWIPWFCLYSHSADVFSASPRYLGLHACLCCSDYWLGNVGQGGHIQLSPSKLTWFDQFCSLKIPLCVVLHFNQYFLSLFSFCL